MNCTFAIHSIFQRTVLFRYVFSVEKTCDAGHTHRRFMTVRWMREARRGRGEEVRQYGRQQETIRETLPTLVSKSINLRVIGLVSGVLLFFERGPCCGQSLEPTNVQLAASHLAC